jgi:hypothetical protein
LEDTDGVGVEEEDPGVKDDFKRLTGLPYN